MTKELNAADPGGSKKAKAPTLRWDDSKMQTTYANAVNAASSQEEVVLFFGTNQTWKLDDAREVTVRLSDRVVLNPHTAKRLSLLLSGIVKEYEQRFGTLKLD